jgi:hypothetical protein
MAVLKVIMKAKVSSLLLLAVLASLTNSASAAPSTKVRVPAPPPAPQVHTQAAAPAPVAAAATTKVNPDYVGVAPQQVCVSKANRSQRFTADIALKPGQESLPLFLVVNNGTSGAPFSWIRMRVNGEVLFTEASLKGRREAAIDVTGAIPSGANQVVVEAAGVPGATFTWQLATPPAKVVSFEPKTIQPGGTMVLRGSGFGTDENRVNVIVGGAAGDVVKTTPNALTIKLPPDVSAGASTISLEINGLPPVVVPIAVSGSAPPVVSGVDMWSAPPGTTITVTGKYFSRNASDNQVFFGDIAGQVRDASDKALKVVVPSVAGVTPGQAKNMQITVVSGGTKSANSVAFAIGPRSTDKDYRPSVKFPEQSTQNSSQSRNVTSSSSSFNAASQASLNGAGYSPQSSTEATVQSSSQSGGFSIVPVGD